MSQSVDEYLSTYNIDNTLKFIKVTFLWSLAVLFLFSNLYILNSVRNNNIIKNIIGIRESSPRCTVVVEGARVRGRDSPPAAATALRRYGATAPQYK